MPCKLVAGKGVCDEATFEQTSGGSEELAIRVSRASAPGTMQRAWDVQRPRGRGLLACAGNSQKSREAGQSVEGEKGEGVHGAGLWGPAGHCETPTLQ